MKTAISLALILSAALAVGPALASSRSYALTGFDKIAASNHVNVVVRQGPFAIQVSEPTGRFDDLILDVQGGTLKVARKSDFTWGWWGMGVDRPVYTVTVTAPAWTTIDVSNHANLEATVSAASLTVNATDHAGVSGNLTAPNLVLRASGHADIRGAVSSQALKITATDHAGVHLSGPCASVDVTASSHAHVDGEGLKCQSARISATDHSGVEAFASKDATSRASSHADIAIFGQPTNFQRDASDHSSINRM